MQNSPEHLFIPKKIQQDIAEKWFHLYKWISPEEVKLSVERDFLGVMKYVWWGMAFFSILFAVPFYGDLEKMLLVFFSAIGIGTFFIFLYLLFLSIKRSFLLSKSAFVILTDSSISLWGKIVKLSEISAIKKELKHVGDTFDEELFGHSKLSESKQKLSEQVLAQIFGGYKLFFSGKSSSKISFGKGRDSEKAILLIIALYTLYVGVMSVVYFVWVLFLWGFGKIITWINTKYLLYRGNKVIMINTLFWKVDMTSDNIYQEKILLKNFLEQAQENDWKDGLLLEINSGIERVSSLGKDATSQVVELRNTIYASQYKDMFSFNIYNSWVKKQIIHPLQWIQKLLQKNLEVIESSISHISDQLANPLKSEFSASLKMQKKRLKLQRTNVEKFIPQLEEMILKLK